MPIEPTAPMGFAPVRLPWEHFPSVIAHSSIARLKNQPEYGFAKAGNEGAAEAVVRSLYKPSKLIDRPEFVVPVVQIDRGHFNALPLVFGLHLAKASGARLWLDTFQINQVDHTLATAGQRMRKQPIFAGTVPPGPCLICDDVVTYGSSLANLRGFLESQGSPVIAATTLAAGYNSTHLSPTPNLLIDIQNRYAEDLEKLTQNLGFRSSCLTGREAYFLHEMRTIERLRTVFAEILGSPNRSQGVRI